MIAGQLLDGLAVDEQDGLPFAAGNADVSFAMLPAFSKDDRMGV